MSELHGLSIYVHAHNVLGGTGTARFTYEVVSRLINDTNYKTTVLASRPDWPIGLQQDELWGNSRKVLFGRSSSAQQRIWYLRNRPAIDQLVPGTEVLYMPTESYVPTFEARSIVTMHDAAMFEHEVYKSTFSQWRQKLRWQLLHSLLAKRVDKVHTVSCFSAERLQHFFPMLRGRIEVVHNGVSQLFFTAPSSMRQRSSDRPMVLVPGGLSRRKNGQLILSVIESSLKKNALLEFVVSGTIDNDYADYARKLAIDERVSFTGYIPDESLRDLYWAANIVWFPTTYEGFGIPVLEAMAAGTPVISSNTAAIPEVAGDAAILLNGNEVNSHLDSLVDLSRDCALQKRLSEAGRIRAAEFSWAKSVAGIRGLIDSLL